ncbi:MAG: hypothetical protein ACXAE3_09675 [Candidatus Kariarchaeaceae archaeon]
MLDSKDLTAEHQNRLLNSLARTVSLNSLPKPTLKLEPRRRSLLRSGHGSLDAHMTLMRHYICQCGSRFSVSEHSTSTHSNGTALDTYTVECGNCGDEEDVSFMSLRNTLRQIESPNKVDTRNKHLYPYL